MEREITAYLLKLRKAHPFFATLSMFARYRFVERVEQFETDGSDISINPAYFRGLLEREKTGVLLHITLHTALLHAIRVGVRNRTVWNIASDIVVNNIILEAGDFDVPPQTSLETRYSGLSVEQVYESLMNLHKSSDSIREAALTEPYDSGDGNPRPNDAQIQGVIQKLYPVLNDLAYPENTIGKPSVPTAGHSAERYWKNVFRKAEVAMKYGSKQQGTLPAGMLREIDRLMNPQLDWRWLLWNFTVRTPSDFSGFDRRFVYRGIYLDKLESESLDILLAIDTSGSIDEEELRQFCSELVAIQNTYHFINVVLYYVDAGIYGPYELAPQSAASIPIGGGGTDFSVFFEHMNRTSQTQEFDLIIYFTDGFGAFPERPPSAETLWVVTSGGLESDQFPFGQVARLSN